MSPEAREPYETLAGAYDGLTTDVDYAAVEPLASVITPVPGGVGPMTIACLMENTVECFLRKMER